MNIKKHFIFASFIALIVPVIITIITAFAFIFINTEILNKDLSYNNFQKLISVRTELLNTASNLSQFSGEDFQKRDYKLFLENKLDSFQGNAVITKGKEVIYASSKLDKIEVENILISIKATSFNNKLILDGEKYICISREIDFKDGTEGYFILIAQSGEQSISEITLFIIVLFTFISSFVVVNIILSISISKKIIRPITNLSAAASEISEGNLKLEVIEEGDEEIKKLCHDFERMRIQLMDSVNLKMKYDDNRRMLVSSISHDLKTPITSIKGYVEGILDGVAGSPEKQKEYLTTIYKKAEHMDILIDDLLLFSKLDLNQIPFNFEKVDILKYVSFIAEEYNLELSKYNIQLNLINSLARQTIVMLDRERMNRVFFNLLENSRKYMDKKAGIVDIILRETNSGNSVIIQVKDNGSGIDSENTNKIFDRFYRGDAARTSSNGSGLGLAICKQIVEGHCGRIWAINNEVVGTSILISLAKAAES